MNMSDYANLLLAFTTLAKAPVARYPHSGAYMEAEKGQDVARAKLANEAMKKAQKKAEKKAKKASLVKGATTLAGAVIGGPVLKGGLAGAGLGASLGGEVGNMATGVGVDPAAVAGAFKTDAEGAEGEEQYNALGGLYKRKKKSVLRNESVMERDLERV